MFILYCYILYLFTVEADYINEQMNTLYKIIHTVNFNTSIQALMLIYQVMDSRSGADLHFCTDYMLIIMWFIILVMVQSNIEKGFMLCFVSWSFGNFTVF